MTGGRNERGFSVVELLVAIAALALVLAAATTIQQGILQAYVVGSNRSEVQHNARVALELLARELRQTPGALTSATATSLTLQDQGTGAAVIYALTGDIPNATLTRSADGVAAIVIGRIQALTFTYRDVNNNVLLAPVGVPANVFRIDITVQTASEDTVVAGGIADTKAQVTTSVRLRNL